VLLSPILYYVHQNLSLTGLGACSFARYETHQCTLYLWFRCPLIEVWERAPFPNSIPHLSPRVRLWGFSRDPWCVRVLAPSPRGQEAGSGGPGLGVCGEVAIHAENGSA